jgi:uncharacterized membrane protein HdeD (DUF308 family)
MFEGFLLGIIVTASLACGAFFLKFWQRTRDTLFLAFGAAFIIEGLNRLSFLFIDNPNEGSPTIYIVRLLAFALILAAIVKKNRVPAR